MKSRDLIGKKFGKLHVKKFFGSVLNKRQWECVCECGNETILSTAKLTNGKSRSCGCADAAAKSSGRNK